MGLIDNHQSAAANKLSKDWQECMTYVARCRLVNGMMFGKYD